MKEYSYNFQRYLIYLIPLGLVFSIFFADLFLVLFSLVFLIHQIKNQNYKLFYNRFVIFFVFFWIYLIFNSIISFDPNISFSRSISYLRFGIFFIALSFFLNFFNFRKNFLRLIFFLVILVCIDSIIQYFVGFNILGYKTHPSRASSFFGDELVLGSFLLKLYPIFLISIFSLKMNIFLEKKKIIILIAIILYFCCIFISGERTAFFNFILLNLILLITLYEKKYLKYIFFFFLTISLFTFASYIKNKNTFERYMEVKTLLKSDEIVIFSNTHQKHYRSAYKIYNENKLFGSGLKTFREICKNSKYYPEGCATHPHNIIMQFLSELGIFGLIFYLIALIYMIRKLIIYSIIRFKSKSKFTHYHRDQIILISSIIINLWPLSPSGNFFNNWISILIYLTISFFVFYEKKLNIS